MAYKNKLTERSYMRKRKKILLEQNLCLSCASKPIYKGQHCIECRPKILESKRNYSNKMRMLWAKLKICTRCGQREPMTGFKTCGYCSEESSETKREIRDAERLKKGSPDHGEGRGSASVDTAARPETSEGNP